MKGAPSALYDRLVKIELDEVRRIAKLAHLEFDESQIAVLAGQLSSILTHMESLARIDTSRVEPTFHSLEHDGLFREDAVRPSLGADKATEGAPNGGSGRFLVPRIIG